ncbi:MAG: response regulator [Bacillota bacterium]|nr:response regulator [Bacillota bacterium]
MNNQMINMQRELARKQQELIDNQALLDAAMKNTNMLVWVYDHEKKCILNSNDMGKDLALPQGTEYTPQTWIDMRLIDKCSEEDFRELHAGAEQGKRISKDIKISSTNAKGYAWKRVIYTPVFDDRGNCHESIGTATDITEQKERELNYENQLRIADILTQSEILTGLFNVTGNRVEKMNIRDKDDIPEMMGSSMDIAVQRVVDRYVAESERRKILDVFQSRKLLDEFLKGHRYGKIRHHNSDMTCWLEAVYELVQNPYTGDIEAIVILRDISELVRAEQVVDTLVNFDYECIQTIQADSGETVSYSDRETELLEEQRRQRNSAEGVEVFLRKYCADEDVEAVVRKTSLPYIKKMLQSSSSYETSYNLLLNGKRVHRRVLYTYLDEMQQLILCAVQDLTEIYEKEARQREQLQEALEAARRADQAKTEFLSRMSHDIRTPLNAILNLNRLLNEEINEPKKLREDIAKIEVAGEFLLQLINDVLDISRIESGHLELKPSVHTYDMFINYIRGIVMPLCEDKDIAFVLEEGSTLPDIHVDRARFNQVFFNLLSNAVKFTPPGGTVSFAARNNVVHDGILTCDFVVSDTGCGMSRETIENVFEPFVRGNSTEAYVGSGLGLAICKQILDKMCATIKIESEEGKGTIVTVHMDLPVATEEQRLKYRAELNTGYHSKHVSIEAGDCRVLIVEDSDINAEILQRLLEKNEIQVERVCNGQEAVHAIHTHDSCYYQMVFMDVRMPVMDGITATRRIRQMEEESKRSIPIIAITANAFESDIKECLGAGMNSCLAKPVDPQKLHEMITTYI